LEKDDKHRNQVQGSLFIRGGTGQLIVVSPTNADEAAEFKLKKLFSPIWVMFSPTHSVFMWMMNAVTGRHPSTQMEELHNTNPKGDLKWRA